MSITNAPPTVRRWSVLAICCTSILLVSLDVTVVNVALPAIGTDLHASLSGLQWTVDAYTVVLAVLLMMAGSLGDRLGRRRVFSAGLLLFTLGSLLCGLAPGLGWLIAFRVVQAVGGSMLNPVAMSIIVNTFHDAGQRARAIGVWAAVVGVSMALGPVVGGALVSGLGWRSIFWLNVPVALVAFVLTRAFVPESRAPRARSVDLAGQVLVVVLLGALTSAIIEAPERGWLAPRILALYGLTVLAGGALVVVERRHREPLIDLRFFRSAPFAGATGIAVVAFAAFGAFLLVNTLYLQGVRGYPPVTAGLLTLPMAVLVGIGAPLSGRLVAGRGARLPLVVAGLATTLGALMLLPLSPHTPYAQLIVAYILIGIGFGLVNPPITNTATSGMPRTQAGVAAAVASTSRQAGSGLGVAVGGSLVAGTAGARFAHASHLVWAVVAGCGVIVFALGLASTGGRARATTARVRHLFDTEVTGHDDRIGTAA